MMKLAVPALLFILALSPSQAKTSDAAQATPYLKHSVLKNPTRTKSVLARAVPRPQRKFLATNVLHIDDENDDPAGPDELDLHVFYARPRLASKPSVVDDSDELSEYITVRLAVARAKAMEAYRNKLM